MDIDMNVTRGRLVSPSPKSSRESSVLSNALSMNYAERVQAQANTPSWAEQMDNESLQTPSLSYETVKVGDSLEWCTQTN